jgi:hypothetical protein
MNKTATVALTALLGLGLAVPAQAQYSKPIGVSVRAGLFFPNDSTARDREGQSWFTAGAEYKLRDMNIGTNQEFSGSLSLSVDFYNKGSYSNVPVLLNYIGRTDQFYYGLGAGVGFGKVPAGVGGSRNDTDFNYGLTIGYDFVRGQTPLFVEAKYFGSNESALNGFAIVGGVRF